MGSFLRERCRRDPTAAVGLEVLVFLFGHVFGNFQVFNMSRIMWEDCEKLWASNAALTRACAVSRLCASVQVCVHCARVSSVCAHFNYHDFLVVWNKMIVAPYMARHSGSSIDAALGTRTRKEIQDRGWWKSDRSVLRYEQRARLHKSFHRLPAAYQAYALRCENVLHKVISGSTPITGLKLLPVR